MKARVFVPPVLARATVWTAERIARLNMIEVRQLKDNALRLSEPEIAALCDAAMTQLRRASAAAAKLLPRKPRKVAKVLVEE